jgi:succinate dehydrogenase / fumarate reductase flavoprotein subunit
MCIDALHRNESAGGHFREEFQSQDGEAVRNDHQYMYVAAWKYQEGHEWELHKEELKYDEVKANQRSYR